ncbi:MAG: sugar transporter permease [Paenibacillaceae bacterium]|jgi:putative aldouronate transport system permease protein|nr:sugar transporter permease [Paenibacillaceae bacterium]
MEASAQRGAHEHAPPSRPSNSPLAVSRGTNLAINIFFSFYTIMCLLPIVLIIMISITDEKTVLINGYSFFPEKFSLSAYRFLLEDWRQITRSLGVSLIVTVVGTAASLLIMALYAYPISRRDFPHRNIFSFIIFFTMLFNGGLVPWYLVYTQLLDLKNTLASLILPLLVSGFFVLMMRTFFSTTIPLELLEAAKIDGAGESLIFVRIVLPLSLPVLATVALFQTVNYWNDWFLSLVFITGQTGKEQVSLQFLMYRTMLDIQFLSSNTSAAQGLSQSGGLVNIPTETVRMAMAVLGIGPIVLAYPFFQRYFIKGLTIGAVKG